MFAEAGCVCSRAFAGQGNLRKSVVICATAVLDWLSSTVTVAVYGNIGLPGFLMLAVKYESDPNGSAVLTGTPKLSLVKTVKGAVPPVNTKGILVVQSPALTAAGNMDSALPVCPLAKTVISMVTVLPDESTTATGTSPSDVLLMVRVVPLAVAVTTAVLPLVAV